MIHLLKLIAGSFVFVVVLAACSKDDDNPMADITDTEVFDGVVYVSPYEYPKAFRNPMKGLREYFCPGYDTKRTEYPLPFGSMVKEYMQWNMMENIESDGVEKVIAYSNHRWEGVEDINMKVIPRPYIVWMEKYNGGYAKNTYTDNPDDLNGWHWPSDFPPVKRSEDEDTPSTGGYFDPSFSDRIKELVKKMGEAWDNDPRVAYIEMGIIGEWGEHHDPCISNYWKPIHQDYHVDNRTWIPGIEKVLGDAFSEAFKNKKVMVRYAYDFQDYEFGNYWDSFAIDEEEERGYNSIQKFSPNRWKTQPMGGEITWNWGSLYSAGYRSLEDCVANGSTRQLIINQIRTLHTNHLGGVTWADFSNKEFLDNISQIQKILGYRFVLKKFSYPTKIKSDVPFDINFSIVNTGSSPFYYNWPVEISLLDIDTQKPVWSTILDDVNITEWMPGDNWKASVNSYDQEAKTYTITKNLNIESNIEPGKYILSIAILDPAGMLPSIRFATRNYFEGGRHPIGYVGIDMDIDNFKIDSKLFDDIAGDKTLKYVINN
ncbi:DUF4832 domain-containing protein [Mariniphaga sediminis]|uniref:DUF4832 domain-containing protein n=1 Tax=Mariniphaga sediminis TaxID=1628158 RepID=UPI003567EC95